MDKVEGDVEGVAVTMPGTLIDSRTIKTSSRLNLHEQLDASDVVEDQCELPTRVYHDMPCMASGFEPPPVDTGEAFSYVFLDEGVGSVLLIGGSTYHGAGVAGSLARMVVEPDGVYFPELSARGTLEAYVGRPWISENCVALWEAEQGKRGGRETGDKTPFRRALGVAAKNNRRGLSYE
jgi:predicted NBD/HSP70 family sugar kinase